MSTAEPPQLPYARDPNSYSAHYQNSSHTNAYAYPNNAGGHAAYGQGSIHGAGSHAQHQIQQYHQQQAYAEQQQQQQQAHYEGYQHGTNGYHVGPDGQLYEDVHDMALQEEAVEEEENGAALQYWTAPRHRVGTRDKGKGREEEYLPWRLKSRSKTFGACMFICLNIGVDPPDIVKTNPCAKMETWIDPGSMPSTKAIEQIGRNLHQQFETLNPKVKFKSCLDPTFDDTKKQCIALRRQAKDDRTVFYYNGHGVPKPTTSGEIWVFNKTYTQYIPVSLQDLQDWLGSLWLKQLIQSPTVHVWECSGAGNILTNFTRAAEKRDAEARQAAAAAGQPEPTSLFADAIHLAACTAAQVLPMSPDLPADLFTCCLTSPIETSLRHFVLQDPLRRNISTSPDDPRSKVTVEMVMRIPGDLKDRRTPLGELNWIFTAVTDTIAWSSFPRDIFNRLFRQDLLVAALFRNFLLAQRIMTTYHCTPMSIPELPMTSNHPLWHSWDLAVDACLSQLPELLEAQEAHDNGTSHVPPLSTYRPSNFFAQHLQAFEVWLQHGGTATGTVAEGADAASAVGHRPPPEQLPIVLQVLLSQAHRLRALILLSRFVDLGPWAVHLSLSIGIYPYVQKLLQSPAIELKPVLIFIWARILAVDKSCQVDLLREQGYEYFAKILSPYGLAANSNQPLSIPNANEHRAMCAFILSTLCRNFRSGQNACLASEVFDACMVRLGEDDWLLKTWSLLCIAQLWADNDDAKALFHSPQRQADLLGALRSTAVEVRAAALYAFGTYLGASAAGADTTEYPGGGGTGAQMGIDEATQLETEAGLAFACLMSVKEDASPMVRKELVVVISCVVREWRGWMVCAAWAYYEQEAALARAERAADEQEKERVKGRASTGRSAFERVPGVSTAEGGGAGSSTPPAGGSDDVMQKALERWAIQDPATDRHNNLTLLSSFKVVFETLLDLSVDPSTEVALMASTVVDYIVALLLDSAFMRVQGAAIQQLPKRKHGASRSQLSTRQPSVLAERMGQAQAHAQAQAQAQANASGGTVKPGLDRRHTAGVPGMSRTNSSLDAASSGGSASGSGANTGLGGSLVNLTRNSSVANALKNLASMTGLIAADSGKEDSESGKEDPTTDVTPSGTTPGAGYTSPYPGADHPRTLPSDQPQSQQRHQQQQHQQSSHPSYNQANPHSRSHPHHANSTGGLARSNLYTNLQYPAEPVDAADVLATMTEEDMERLRIRRVKGTQAGGDVNGHLANNGLARQGDLGLGMVAKEVRDDVLPLRSGFYDWAVEYFKAPQMKAPDADEPGSMTYNAQAWRSIRNEQLVETSRINEDYASNHAWDTEAGTLHNDAWPLQLGFHSFDPVMAVTDDTDKICLWDWKACRKLNKFSNQNVPGSCISSMHFINEMASSLLMTASTEGSVRIWRDYENPGETELASTFRVVSDLHPVAHSSGVLTAWEQSKGHLLVGGDMKVVRLWDATVERHLRDIATQAGSNLTSLASDEPEGNVFVAGFGDGVVRLFDKRAADAGAVVMRTWRKHHTWIQSVHLQRGGQRELVTGSMNGEVRIWDSRAPDLPLYEDIPQPQGLMALAVHPGAPVFASTSAPTGHSTRQRLVIQGFSNPATPRALSNIAIPLVPTYHVPTRPFLPSASSLVFHPVEMVVAAGGFDSSGQVKLYRCPLPENKRHYEDMPIVNGH